MILLADTDHALASAAIAYVETEQGFHYWWVGGKRTQKQAKAEVLKKCKEEAKKLKTTEPCKTMSSNGPAYWAVYHSDEAGIGFASNPDRQSAINSAYEFCQEGGRTCPDTAAAVWYDEGQSPAPTKASGKCSPPPGQTLRYSDRCVNGDCTRTFENGCQVRFQAAYCFDPFQQQWTWKPNGC